MMPMRSAYVRSALLLLLVSACSLRPRTNPNPLPDREVLTQAELVEHNFANAFEAIEALRPLWMETRGSNTLIGNQVRVVVYLNDTRLGGVETLSQITTPAIVSIHHLDGRAATARWGLDHGQGAILVTTF
jgi:hypothetical protein